MTQLLTNSNDDPSNESLQRIAQIITRWRMVTPALLFLAGHRPLAFVASQLLFALQPLADLLEVDTCAEFASVLSAPEGYSRLVAALTEPDAPAHTLRSSSRD